MTAYHAITFKLSQFVGQHPSTKAAVLSYVDQSRAMGHEVRLLDIFENLELWVRTEINGRIDGPAKEFWTKEYHWVQMALRGIKGFQFTSIEDFVKVSR
jgi:hypothetical protein